jgi:hypothetical protein
MHAIQVLVRNTNGTYPEGASIQVIHWELWGGTVGSMAEVLLAETGPVVIAGRIYPCIFNYLHIYIGL